MTTNGRGLLFPLACGLALCFVDFVALAQLPQTQLQSVFPSGGQIGQSIEVTVANGTDLDELNRLVFSHEGIQASQKTVEKDGRQEPVANTFVVQIDKSVPPGNYEVRAAGLFGLSNPRIFAVEPFPVSRETEPNNDPTTAQELPWDENRFGQINGAADLDFFAFEGKAGQLAVIRTEAFSLDSKLVLTAELLTDDGQRIAYGRQRYDRDPLLIARLPADGRYLIKVHDFIYAGGVDYAYRVRVSAQPYVAFVYPPSVQPGQTREVNVYGYNLPNGQPVDGHPHLQRLAVKIAGPSQSADAADVAASLRIDALQVGLNLVPWNLQSGQTASNPVPLFLSELPVVLDNEPNDGVDGQWQAVELPAEVVGQFGHRGDIDGYQFEAKAGDIYFVEVVGHRIGSKLDPYLVIEQVQLNEDGSEKSVKRLSAQDDGPANVGGIDFNTLSDDPVSRFQVPADGLYRIRVWDRYRQTRFGQDLVYRLIVRREQPDFQLIAVAGVRPTAANQPSQPGAVVLRRGENNSFQVLALRQDGFDGPIQVSVEGLPKGVISHGAVIGSGQSAVEVILEAGADAAVGEAELRVVGQAVIDDPALVRQAEQLTKQVVADQQALDKTVKPRDDAQASLEKAQATAAQAKQQSDAKPDDANLKKALATAESALTTARDAFGKADMAWQAAKKQLADRQAELTGVQQSIEKTRRNEKRTAAPGGVVWPGSATLRSVARLQQQLQLSVIDEQSPLQVDVTGPVGPVDVTAGQQLLLPVKLHKRNSFDNNVALALQGVDAKSKIQPENKTINKGSDSEQIKVAVDKSAPEGAYTLFLQSTVQVAYERNPARVARAEEGVKTADAEVKSAAEAVTAATAKRDEARKAHEKATADATAAKTAVTTAQTQVNTAKKQLDDAAALLKKQQAVTAQADAAVKAEKSATDDLAKKSQADPENAALAQQLKQQQQKLAAAEQELKKAQDAQAAAEQALAKQQKAYDDAAKTLAEMQKTATAAEKLTGTAKATLDQLEAALKKVTDEQKAVAARKAAADKELKDAQAAAKAKNTNYRAVSEPLLVRVHRAPVEVTASVADGGKLKQGAAVEATVQVKRINDFSGPVTVKLNVPEAVAGVTAADVVIPADATEGKLQIQAGKDATEGQLKYLTVRVAAEFDGRQALVDAPVNVTVSK